MLDKRGWLRLYALNVDGRAHAVDLDFAYRGKVYGYLRGFAPDLGKYSPGMVLTGATIKDAIEEGLTEFDMLTGNEEYKLHWENKQSVTFRMIVHTNALRSAAALLATNISRVSIAKIRGRLRSIIRRPTARPGRKARAAQDATA
jgi:CelD/BcsL family acetyltransferase involved in cellulose biosynthesis